MANKDPGHSRTRETWNHDPGDLGAHGESHKWNDDGTAHHTLWREDGSHISWNTDKDGDYSGGGHTVDSDGNITNWD